MNLNTVIRLCSVFLFFVGTLVMFSWYFELSYIVQTFSYDSAPMQFNTALGFVFSSFIIYTLSETKLSKYHQYFDVFLFTLSLLTLIQYLFGISIGIDKLLFENPYILEKTSTPGRMAPSTALCFMFLAIASFFHMRKKESFVFSDSIPVLMFSIILSMGLFSLFGYVVKEEGTFGWLSFTEMAINTSICFVVVGFIGMYSIYCCLFLEKISKYFSMYIIGISGTLMFLIISILSEGTRSVVEFFILFVVIIAIFLIYATGLINNTQELNENLLKANNELSEQRNMYETLTESIPYIIWFSEEDGYTTYQNKSYELLTGKPPSETLGFGWMEDIHPADRDNVLKIFENARINKSRHEGECTFISGSGEHKVFYYIASPVKDENGLVKKWVGINTDITAMKETHKLLHLESQKYKTILNSLSEIIFIVDENEVYLEYKDGRKKFHTGNDIMVGSNMKDNLPEKLYVKISKHLKKVRETKKEDKIGYYFRDVDGGVRYYESVSVPYDDGTLSIVRDITETINDKKNIENQNRELTNFARSLAHDLLSPARSIEGLTQILKEDYSDKFDSDGKELLDSISSLSVKTSDIIDASRELLKVGGNLDIKKNSICDIIQWAVENIVHDDVSFDFSKDKDIYLYVDKIQLGRVFQNLFSNSIKYNENDPVISIDWKSKGGFVTISVKDNGIGIKSEYIDKIFNMFYRINREIDGTGLGLSICKKIIEVHGGKIWAESDGVNGTIFYFTIPSVH